MERYTKHRIALASLDIVSVPRASLGFLLGLEVRTLARKSGERVRHSRGCVPAATPAGNPVYLPPRPDA